VIITGFFKKWGLEILIINKKRILQFDFLYYLCCVCISDKIKKSSPNGSVFILEGVIILCFVQIFEIG
jgi:hypothetical protein